MIADRFQPDATFETHLQDRVIPRVVGVHLRLQHCFFLLGWEVCISKYLFENAVSLRLVEVMNHLARFDLDRLCLQEVNQQLLLFLGRGEVEEATDEQVPQRLLLLVHAVLEKHFKQRIGQRVPLFGFDIA